MWKTFFASPAAGGVAALLGWIGAVVFKESMTDAEFAALRFGWSGAMVGAIAISTLVMLMLVSDMVEPVVTAVSAALFAFFLWNERELPFSTRNFEGTTATYWFTFTMMAIIFVLLLMGLRAARESTTRNRRR